MTDESGIPCHICSLPTELILNIFVYLPAKDLMKCRQVYSRWKLIIDALASNDELWVRYCKRDFPTIYRNARLRANSELKWFDLYKSLSLWSNLADAREETDEFASATGVMQEIRSFEMLDEGVIGVLNKSAIVYYDIATLEVTTRGPINGSYSRYSENQRAIVILNYELHLFVIRTIGSYYPQELNKTFDNVKLFTLSEGAVHFVTLNDEIFVCDLCSDDKMLNAKFIKHSEDSVMALGCTDHQLNILTCTKNIYTVVNNEMVFACTLGPDSNLFHQLQKYNLLDQMDWRIYMQWMYVFHHTVPAWPFRDLIIVRQYGDIFFVGSNWGVLRIYYVPSFDTKLDLFNMEPVKQYNFMERSDCPVLSICPIIGVDVLETENGHKVLVAMPKKIAVLTFTHFFKRTASLAMLPYDEVQRVKMLKIDATNES